MNKNIFSELKSSLSFLTKTEQIIGKVILNDPNKFTKLSITELSGITGVSQGSINNFSKKLCGGGFADLKIKVASSISAFSEKPFSVIDKNSSMKAVLSSRIDEITDAFNITMEINDETYLKTAAEKIISAEKVEILGVYQSGIVARDFCYQLIQLGIPASYVEDTLMSAVSASMLNENSLVIALSNSGSTKEIIDTIEIAKNCNAYAVCITSNKYSPLADISDCVLLTANSGTTISERQNETRLSQLLLTDTLCSYIRSVMDETGKKHYFKLEKILNSHSVKND